MSQHSSEVRLADYLEKFCPACNRPTSVYSSTCPTCQSLLQYRVRDAEFQQAVRALSRLPAAGKLNLNAGGMLSQDFPDAAVVDYVEWLGAVHRVEKVLDLVPALLSERDQLATAFPGAKSALLSASAFLGGFMRDLQGSLLTLKQVSHVNRLEEALSQYRDQYVSHVKSGVEQAAAAKNIGTKTRAPAEELPFTPLSSALESIENFTNLVEQGTKKLQNQYRQFQAGLARLPDGAVSLGDRQSAGEYRAVLQAAREMVTFPYSEGNAGSKTGGS